MIRKAIIAVLTLATVASVVLWAVSVTLRPTWNLSQHIGHWTVVAVWNGHAHFLEELRVGDAYTEWEVDEIAGWRVVMHHSTATEFLGFYWHDVPVLTAPVPSSEMSYWPSPPGGPVKTGNVEVRHRQVSIQLWAPVLLFGAYPLYSLIRFRARRRRHRRREQGLCVDCGYDLTGNESGKCSECGVRIEEP